MLEFLKFKHECVDCRRWQSRFEFVCEKCKRKEIVEFCTYCQPKWTEEIEQAVKNCEDLALIMKTKLVCLEGKK